MTKAEKQKEHIQFLTEMFEFLIGKDLTKQLIHEANQKNVKDFGAFFAAIIILGNNPELANNVLAAWKTSHDKNIED